MYKVLEEDTEVDQGCLVKTQVFSGVYSANLGLILTPKCDLENKAEFITLAGVETTRKLLGRLAVAKRKPPRRLDKQARVDIRSRVKPLMEGRELRWHFLHPTKLVEDFENGAFVDFQLVSSVPADVGFDLPVVGEIKGPWAQEVAARYAAFMGRVGTEDVDGDIWQGWVGELQDLFPLDEDGSR